jgi:predicted DsbA family dithiol-disulfide isomerase
MLTKIETVITWKPYLLRPKLPEEGVLKSDPSPESRVSWHLKKAGQSVGINFTGLTDRTPNTILFHSVIKMLQDELSLDDRVVTEFHEAVFEGYFTTGVYPDKEGLMKAARVTGDPRLVGAMDLLFKDQEKLKKLKKEVLKEARDASRRGVSGVPSFEFNGEPAFSGAQPVETFVEALKHYAK